MKILILTTHLNPGGISRYVVNLARELKKGDHQVWVACGEGEWINKLKRAGINYKQIPIKTKSICSPKIVFSFFSLLPLIIREKIDLVHGNTRVTQFLSFLLYKFMGIGYVSSFHGFYKRGLFRRLFKFSGVRTIAVSKAVRGHLVEDLGIKEDKISVVYNGIDYRDFCSKRRKKRDYGFSDDDFVVGILGRISQEKGHFLAAEAMKSIFAIHKNVYFLIAGRGKLEDELGAFLKHLEIERRARFIIWETEDILDILDLLLMPSKKEGFGYVILESFAKGVSVVGFNTGGIPEIIRDKENGVLFYNHDKVSLAAAIEEIISNEGLRLRITEQAKEDVLTFSLKNMALATEKVYEEALGRQ